MRAHFLAGTTITILLAVQAAYSQAAAESVLLNSNSAAATVKAGTSIGNALNKASGKLANQVPTAVNHPKRTQSSGVNVVIERTPRTAAPATAATTTAKPATSGTMITSIQGGHITRPAVAATAPADK